MDAEIKKSQALNNVWAWGIALSPLVIGLLIYIFNPSDGYLFGIILVFWFVCIIGDSALLSDSGYKSPGWFWGLFLPPVYLWKRANVIGAKKIHFSAWIIAFALSFVFDYISYNDALGESACPIVSKILKDNLGDNSAECVKVNITGNITDNLYKGVATLNTGNEINITVEEKAGNMIYVRVPPQYLQ